jgi:hypothetical protein
MRCAAASASTTRDKNDTKNNRNRERTSPISEHKTKKAEVPWHPDFSPIKFNFRRTYFELGTALHGWAQPFESVTELMCVVESFHPTTTTFRSPAVWADVYVTATVDCGVWGTAELTCTKPTDPTAKFGSAVNTIAVRNTS